SLGDGLPGPGPSGVRRDGDLHRCPPRRPRLLLAARRPRLGVTPPMAAGPFIDAAPPVRLVERLEALLPGAALSVAEFRNEMTIEVAKDRLVEVCRALKTDPETACDMLTDVTAVHYLEGDHEYEVIYQLNSLERHPRLRL